MAKVFLLDVKDRQGDCAVAHVDIRHGRPAMEQADAVAHRELGRLFLDWWSRGQRQFVTHHAAGKITSDLTRYLAPLVVPNNPQETGRRIAEWNQTPRKLVQTVQLPSGLEKSVGMDLRVILNQKLRAWDRDHYRKPGPGVNDGGSG
ncbi:MAG: hypothetical protein VW405_23650 [Rhodospirillaceae bacterium]